ncbi:MAG: LysM peptidoglycan-binding domain-containing protein [Chloroflexi bacterium]|nr:LysM peptidoglycan-binding domain-containing protein [Chloroflexota bacterium]
MNWRRLFFYLILNAIVSAAVTFSVLAIWDATHSEPAAIATHTPIPQPPLAATQVAAQTQPPLIQATVTPTLYEVKGGDTLGSISLDFDVSVDDILAANGLTDPNALSVGQILVIPVGGLPKVTATAEALINPEGTSVTPPPTGTSVVQQGVPQLAIRAVVDPGNLATEKVTLVNLGGPVELAGWTLRDDQGNVYPFPVLSLFQGGAINIHTGLGRDTVTDLYWGQGGAMWQAGETATLVDPQGQTHTTFLIP